MLAGHRGQGADDLCFHRPAPLLLRPGAGRSWTIRRLCFPRTRFWPRRPGRGAGDALRRQDETFCLAYPWDPRRPFPLTPAFCLARVKPLRGQPHVIFRFRPEGVPIPPAEEE